MKLFDTIAAVSTPRGKGGVAVIRISGPEALAVGDAVFSKKLSETKPRCAVYGKIHMPQPDGSRVEVDDGLATVFLAPASFTGEDTVEIACHGGALVTSVVLSAVLAAGARQAEAGEFTRRAYINGRTTLDRAEALSALLEAKTLDQLRLARTGMSGALSNDTDALYDRLLTVTAELRADIDFPDEDVSQMTPDELRERLVSVLEGVKRLCDTYTTGRAIAEGVETVICGRTNSGKSSLYNRILGQDAAIVTDIEGTTRDILTDTASFGGVTLRISDTAGLRDSRDAVEKIGIERAMSAIDKAGLVLVVIDGSREPSDDDRAYIERIRSRAAFAVAVLNKCDLGSNPEAKKLAESFDRCVVLSAKTGENIEELQKAISDAFIDDSLDLTRDSVVSTERQYGALVRAGESVRSALDALDSGLPTDLVCSELECGLSRLADICGREAAEDIVSGIFSKFCVGK